MPQLGPDFLTASSRLRKIQGASSRGGMKGRILMIIKVTARGQTTAIRVRGIKIQVGRPKRKIEEKCTEQWIHGDAFCGQPSLPNKLRPTHEKAPRVS